MKLAKYFLTSIIATSFVSAAHGQDSGSYGAIGVTSYELDTYGLDAKFGYNFNKYFGIEAQGVLGLTTNSSRLCSSPSCATIKEKVDHTIGAFAIARLPLNEEFEVFARGGIHNTKYSYDINNLNNTMLESTKTGVAAGGGLQYNLNSNNAIRAEYTYLDKSNLDTVSVGYVRKF